jgi:hypothetical protein
MNRNALCLALCLTAALILTIPVAAVAAPEPANFHAYFESFCTFKKCKPGKGTKVVRDDKNGYLQAKTEGEYTTEVSTFVMWVTADKSRLFGFAEDSLGYMGDSYKASFWTYGDGKWTETKNATPSISLKDFWGEGQPLPEKKYQHIRLQYVLPRRGTTLLVRLQAYNEPDNAQALGEAGFNDEEYGEALDKRKYDAIELAWDAKTGTFSKGRQIPKKR